MTAATLFAGRYELLSHLGQSGQGDVYVARDQNEGGFVALKLLTSTHPAGTWVEAQILRQLSDAHILPIRNADQFVGQPYLVTDLAHHGTLETRLSAAGGLGVDVDQTVRWIRQACQGVARAHDLRLIHSDIKPGNLFLNAEEECLVGDFGAAVLLPPGADAVAPYTHTPITAAPEIARNWRTPAPAASFRSDIYALGATAFLMMTSEPPVDLSGCTDADSMMSAIATQPPRRLRDLAPHVPNYVATAVETAIASNPADRFADTTELAAALGRRPSTTRRWQRTNEHAAHIGCWRGIPDKGGSTYIVCVESGPGAKKCQITASHVASGRRINAGCKVVYAKAWPQALRSVFRALS